jgi:hypothetical protein
MRRYSGTIIVAGSGRSGTTWLGNIIAGDEYRILFEPFDQRRVPEFSGLSLRPYFRPTRDYPQWRPMIEKVIKGDIANEWVDQDLARLDGSRAPAGVLIKEIRANGVLAWLERNFGCKIVFLLRHPCAVIASRMKLKWETHIDAFLSQPELMEDHLYPYEDVMKRAETDVEKHAIMWCVENFIPLNQMKQHNWITCRYEELVDNAAAEVHRILLLLGLDFTDSRRRAIAEVVRTNRKVGLTEKRHFLDAWQKAFTQREMTDIGRIVQMFGLTVYNNYMPQEQPR